MQLLPLNITITQSPGPLINLQHCIQLTDGGVIYKNCENLLSARKMYRFHIVAYRDALAPSHPTYHTREQGFLIPPNMKYRITDHRCKNYSLRAWARWARWDIPLSKSAFPFPIWPYWHLLPEQGSSIWIQGVCDRFRPIIISCLCLAHPVTTRWFSTCCCAITDRLTSLLRDFVVVEWSGTCKPTFPLL